MENVLLTGSEGYIGKNFQNLYKNKYKLIPVDYKLNIKAQDINEFDDINYIVHLAAVSGIKSCYNNIQKAIIDNVSSTLHLMKASWAFNIPMIFVSSQAAKDPLSSLYATTKRIGEIEAERYNNQHSNIKVLRLSNVYGGRYYLKHKNSVISKFINAKRNKEPLIIHGDGTQTRDFIHVNEICRCVDMCINDIKIPEPVDVGSGIERSIKEVAEMISNNVKYNESVSGGIGGNIADITKIYKYVGFEPQDKLQEYIQSVY